MPSSMHRDNNVMVLAERWNSRAYSKESNQRFSRSAMLPESSTRVAANFSSIERTLLALHDALGDCVHANIARTDSLSQTPIPITYCRSSGLTFLQSTNTKTQSNESVDCYFLLTPFICVYMSA
eukprot:scpid32669/ scgid26953/ 